MMPASDPRSREPNIQDAFFNHVRRQRLTVLVRMMDGAELEGRVKNFDRFAVVLDHAGSDYLLFKHAIAAIRTPQSFSDYSPTPSG